METRDEERGGRPIATKRALARSGGARSRGRELRESVAKAARAHPVARRLARRPAKGPDQPSAPRADHHTDWVVVPRRAWHEAGRDSSEGDSRAPKGDTFPPHGRVRAPSGRGGGRRTLDDARPRCEPGALRSLVASQLPVERRLQAPRARPTRAVAPAQSIVRVPGGGPPRQSPRSARPGLHALAVRRLRRRGGRTRAPSCASSTRRGSPAPRDRAHLGPRRGVRRAWRDRPRHYAVRRAGAGAADWWRRDASSRDGASRRKRVRARAAARARPRRTKEGVGPLRSGRSAS